MKWDRTRGRPEPIAALNQIVEVDNGEPLVDLRKVSPSVRVYRESTLPYCRETVAKMAERAAKSLPSGVFLAVSEGWRPFERQQKIYDWLMACAKEVYPDRSYAALRRTVCKLVAPTDQKAPPGHCTGAALDVHLVDDNMTPLDVVSPFTRFTATATYTIGLSETAHANRMLLIESMLGAGFSNCRDEYWHYSYGDAGWAVREGLTECFYGLVTMDPSLYAKEEALATKLIRQRENPFLAIKATKEK